MDNDVQRTGLSGTGDRGAEFAEPTHTPGPWRTFERPMGIEILCSDRLAPIQMPSAGIRIAEIRFKRLGRGGQFLGNTADAANASLISVAPDLYAALAELLDVLAIVDRGWRDGNLTVVQQAIDEAVISRARAALSKAETK